MARPTFRVIDTDRGYSRIVREINRKGKARVQVGVFGSKAAAAHQGGKLTVVDVATTNEFGAIINHPGGTAYETGPGGQARFVSNTYAEGKDLPRTAPHTIKIPERSFIRKTVDIKKRQIARVTKNLAIQVLAGRVSRSKALTTIGVLVQGLIKARMSRGIPPPNTPSTIARKGSAKPLIDKGQLRSSIVFEVKGIGSK